MTAAELRAAFPVLDRLAYLNAGTCGPLARAAVDAARAELEAGAAEGRGAAPYFERFQAAHAAQREAYAARLGARPSDVALTTSTSEGVVRVLAGLDLEAGDEVITAVGEHPGLLGPLSHLASRGVRVRTVELADVAEAAVASGAALVACSHVSWITGEVAPAELAQLDIPVLLDGAQGAGAIAVDVATLGCAFYAAAGQKWLCGPIGTGLLYVAPDWQGRLRSVGPTYANLSEPNAGLGAQLWADARAQDASAIALEASAAAVAADGVLGRFGWDATYARARELAGRLADALRDRGRRIAPRGDTTLVAWEEEDPPATKARLAAAGVIVRDLPGWPLVRASVGAWNDEEDLERLLAAL